MLAAPEGRCKHMGGESASTTSLEKGCADKRKINIQTVRVMRRPVIKNAPLHGPR